MHLDRHVPIWVSDSSFLVRTALWREWCCWSPIHRVRIERSGLVVTLLFKLVGNMVLRTRRWRCRVAMVKDWGKCLLLITSRMWGLWGRGVIGTKMVGKC